MSPLLVITIGLFSLVVACLACIVVVMRASAAILKVDEERDEIPTLGPEQIVRVDTTARQVRRWERWHRSLEN